jgi:voltage-gated potassium channel
MTSRKRLIISLLVLTAVFWVGVTGYLLIDRNLTFLDAVYQVAITLSTVGYHDLSQPTALTRIWTVIIVFFGVTSTFVAIGAVTWWFVEGEVERLIGSRKLESQIKCLNKHVIICGFGRMGKLVVQRLTEQRIPVVVIENDPNKLRQIEELGQLYIAGDATEEASLERAGIGRARSLVAALPSDADNVFVTLTAREMSRDLYIVARAEQFSAEPKLRHAGANRVISTQAIGAERIANVLIRPSLVDFVEVAAKGVDLEMDEFEVTPDSPLSGRTLRESDIRHRADVIVVAIKRADGTSIFNPAADERVQPKDTLITIGPGGATTRLAELQLIPETQ